MNRGVLQSSSPVQPMIAGGNPAGWWNINGIRSPPPLPPPAPPVFLGGVAPPANLFPDHLYVPTASSASASSSSSSTSWQDLNNPELPESCSQLILRGLMVGEDYKSRNSMCHFQDQQSPIVSSAMDHVKRENSTGSYSHIYGHLHDQQDFRLGSASKPSPWSPMVPVSSSATGSCTTSMETNGVLDFSKKKPGTRNVPARDRAYECNSGASGGAQKKARVQPSSVQSTIKVRKEKLGDRITALHQLVSPFGKTDTASVLLEAIGYIRFLQGQIEARSSSYLGKVSGNPCSHHNSEEETEPRELDLRSRGLCLVPISCTLQVGNIESSVGGADSWAAASFGGGGGMTFP